MIERISAVTLATGDMALSVRFYRTLGFEVVYGGEAASFTTFRAGNGYLNLAARNSNHRWTWWGRVIFYVSDVDAFHKSAIDHGHQPDFSPRAADWGARYFHMTDCDGHELSFARPLAKTDQTRP